ncbi:hypothetical protein RCL10_10510 [Staphylococcus lloydii]|uniref:TrlF family AAA-like ATPase n=1 Tax=Staphylococcus lloydii TaxID=2781774 RepID=UPI00292A0208|nr:hypothetical protein [Staphylococcus lloydii]MDU9418928.1 hypothetical protein [Staphylococcus lloydii]
MCITNKGSQWRKWDLHLHSCYSWLNNEFPSLENGKKDEDLFVDTILNSGLSAIGLTNYFNFSESDFILKKRLEEAGIKTFLNLELRLKDINQEGDLFDYHIIFSDELEDKIIQNFLAKLEIGLGNKETSATNLERKKEIDEAFVSFDKLNATLQDTSLNLEGKYITGFLSRGHGSARNEQNSKKGEGIYEDITRKSHIIIHSSDENHNKIRDREYWLKHNKYVRPLLIGSDAHNLEIIGRKFTWIKSDLSFTGLKQILYEPEHRINLNVECPDDKPDYLVINTIEIGDTTIYLNENLNAIIGGRSTGKSTLLNSIAKYYNSENFEENGMNTFEENLTITWKDNSSDSNKEVEFIPQEHMVNLAHNVDSFNKLVQNIIKNKGLDKEIDLYEKSIKDTKKRISELLDAYWNSKKNLQELIKPEGNLEGIQNQIDVFQKEEDDLKNCGELSSVEWESYKELESHIVISKKDQSILNNDISELEKLSTENILKGITIENLSSSTDEDIRSYYSKLNNRVSKIWNSKIAKNMNNMIKQNEALQKRISELENDSIYKKGQNDIKSNRELNFISRKKEQEQQNLRNFQDYLAKKEKVENYMSELKEKLISEFNNYSIAKNHLENSFIIEEKDLQIKIEFYQKNIEEEIFYLHKTNQFNRNFIDSFHKNLESTISTVFSENEFKFNQNKDITTFINDLFLNNWYAFNFRIMYQNDEFQKMSQGKKAFVILKLLLEFSNNKKPVLIDQPEDSLDNRAIYHELTSYLIEKKKERQIILVTHNPNIVVGADAENVIVANQHSILTPNENNRNFNYINGALENSFNRTSSVTFTLQSQGIREHVYEILEGGKEAFEKRERKYNS